jgi:hypothetical protein
MALSNGNLFFKISQQLTRAFQYIRDYKLIIFKLQISQPDVDMTEDSPDNKHRSGSYIPENLRQIITNKNRASGYFASASLESILGEEVSLDRTIP